MFRLLGFLALSAALLLVPSATPIAYAQEDDSEAVRNRARAIAGEANEAYNIGHFEQALERYEQAYAVFAAPQLLFNLGQCHRELGNHERVVFFFERYLEELPEASNRPVVEELLTESRGEVQRAEAAAEAERQAEQRRVEEARAEAAARAEQERIRDEAARAALREETEDEDTPIYEEWWLWTTIGVALAIGIGITVGVVVTNQGTVLPMGTLGTLDTR